MARHRHTYVEAGRYYQPPPDREINVRGAFDMREMLFGFTTIELRCSECGEVECREFDGKVGLDIPRKRVG